MVPLGVVDLGDLAAIISGVTTIALVGLTYSAVRSGGKAADAAVASAKLTERQLQEAHRPLLVPEDPYESGKETIVPVRNIGVGPAIRVYGCARIRDDEARKARSRGESTDRAMIRETFALYAGQSCPHQSGSGASTPKSPHRLGTGDAPKSASRAISGA